MDVVSIDIKEEDKKDIVNRLLSACDDGLGMAMTFVLSSTLSQLLTDYHENKLNQIQSVIVNRFLSSPECSC